MIDIYDIHNVSYIMNNEYTKLYMINMIHIMNDGIEHREWKTSVSIPGNKMINEKHRWV